MSFILDALRKADAERERDPSRGIHAQAVGLPAGPAASRAVPGWAWALGGVLIAAVVGYVVWPRSQPAPVGAPAAPVAAVPAIVAPAAPPPVVAVPASPAPAAVVLPAAPPAAAAPVAVPATVTNPAPAAVRAAVPSAAAARAAASVPAQAVAAPATERVLPQAELPPEVQRELPKVALSGGVYSDNAAQRFVLVNGQLAHEGTEVAPGVVLEQIRPRSAVLRYRQWRYSVGY